MSVKLGNEVMENSSVTRFIVASKCGEKVVKSAAISTRLEGENKEREFYVYEAVLFSGDVDAARKFENEEMAKLVAEYVDGKVVRVTQSTIVTLHAEEL